MPSLWHDSGNELFKLDPDFAVRLLRLVGVDLPPDTHLIPAPTNETDRFLSKDLDPDTVLLQGSTDKPGCVVILEMQQAQKKSKLGQWPRYAAAQWLRHNCPVELVVICPDNKVAEWYANPIPTSLRGYTHWPHILMPSQVPAMASPDEVSGDPTMAVLSVAYYGSDAAVANAFVAGIASLGAEAGQDYYELGVRMSSQEIRNALELLVSTKYKEPYSEFGKRHHQEGWQEGREEGLAAGREEGREEGLVAGQRDAIRMVLMARGFKASDFQLELIDACTDLATLQRWSQAAVTAASTDEVFE
jgi:hypothetical protein